MIAPITAYRGHLVTFHCRNQVYCRHRVSIPAVELIERFGEDFDLDAYCERLRCSRCGTRGAKVIFSWLSQEPCWVKY